MNCGDEAVLRQLPDDFLRGEPPNFSKFFYKFVPYNNPIGHNVMPYSFRYGLLAIVLTNTVVVIVWERVIVIGPVRRLIRKWKPHPRKIHLVY